MKLQRLNLPENGPECDADLLFMIAFDAVSNNDRASIQEPHRSRLSKSSGCPLLLYIGRVSENDEPDVLIMEGRRSVKQRLSRIDAKLYKAARGLMMKYKMGKEVPTLAIGADESIRMGVLPLGCEDV